MITRCITLFSHDWTAKFKHNKLKEFLNKKKKFIEKFKDFAHLSKWYSEEPQI